MNTKMNSKHSLLTQSRTTIVSVCITETIQHFHLTIIVTYTGARIVTICSSHDSVGVVSI